MGGEIMAEIHKTLYQCDRCLSISEEEPKSCSDYRADYNFKLKESFSNCGGVSMEWSLLCDECHKYVANLIKVIKVEQTKSRNKDAKKG